MLYQRWVDFCLPSFWIRSMPFLGASSDLFTWLATLQCQIWYTSGRDLFSKLCSSEHSLHHLLPPQRKYSNLRNRGHPYEPPEYCTNLHKKSFIIQSLYLYIWFFLFLTFVSCLLTVTLHIVDVRLTCLMNITYLLTYVTATTRHKGVGYRYATFILAVCCSSDATGYTFTPLSN